MYRFYAKENQKNDNSFFLSGTDVNHIKNVLRMKQGEQVIICNQEGTDYTCILESITDKEVIAGIKAGQASGCEPAVKLYLFQGLPKKDKMELIIQKAVELGVYKIIPVLTKRTVVKVEDGKKEAGKLKRWQAIAEGAAKQSGRGIIPSIEGILRFSEAVKKAKELDGVIIPYEMAEDMNKTREYIKSFHRRNSIGIFIGPEGGFEEAEIEETRAAGFIPVTLGKRILRTETAGLTALSILLYELEK